MAPGKLPFIIVMDVAVHIKTRVIRLNLGDLYDGISTIKPGRRNIAETPICQRFPAIHDGP